MPGEEILASGAGSGAWYWVATVVFVIALVAIVSERVHKTKAALVGGVVMILLPILTQDEAFHSTVYGIDYNVIYLLIGMMVLVHLISVTGVFEWTAIRAAKLGRGRPLPILALLMGLTAVASAFLDNVTTVMLMAPVTLLIADELDVDPIPFLIAETLASNVGGTATLIGDPPNIIIGSRAQLGFSDFLVHVAPVVLVMLAALMVGVWFLFRNSLRVSEKRRQRVMAIDERRLIKDRVLATKSLVVLGLTLVGFLAHGALHIEPATIALAGAATLLLISRRDPDEVLEKVEWATIFFFIGLFILVGGIVKVGLVGDLARFVITVTEPSVDSMRATSLVMLWCSGVLSAVIDNIPYAATMSPLVLDMANEVFHDGALNAAQLPPETLHHPVLMPVWWALSLGSCLGGNGTPIGASANVIVIAIAAKSGASISFARFCAYGVPAMLMTLSISHAYLLIRYY